MAKQLVNPIERHVEKAVVAVSAIALLGAAALFLISSPNKIELDGTTVTPTTIDHEVAARATEIRNTLRNHRPTSVVPEPLAEDFIAAAKQTPAIAYASAAPIRPTVPQIDPPITKVADFTLVKVVQPAKPAITSGRSTVNLGTQIGDPLLRPLDWVTVSAVMDRKAQSDLQKHAYGARNGIVHIAPPEIQRRAKRPDGTWSDDDWTAVTPGPAGIPLQLPILEVMEGPNGPMVPFEEKKKLERVVLELTSTEAQRDRLRPLFHELRNGDPWSFPIITSASDVLKQDDEILFPDKPPAANPEDLYGIRGGGIAASATTAELTASQRATANMQLAKEKLARARKERSKFEAREASNLFFAVKGDRAANASLRNEAQKLEVEADDLFNQISRAELTGHGRQVAATGGGKDDAPARQLLPTQQLWVHDAREGSIEGGKTYQYRIRFRIYNLFAGEAAKFENPDDAVTILVASDWSPPSDSVSFEPWEAFFVTADDKTKNQAGFEFFRWFYGAWVKSRRHKFGIGEAVVATQRTTVPSLEIPGESDSDEVEYNAQATVLDIDFTRAYRERRRGSGQGGVRFAAARDETAVVLIDSKGHLTERMIRRDKEHPDKKMFGDQSYKGTR